MALQKCNIGLGESNFLFKLKELSVIVDARNGFKKKKMYANVRKRERTTDEIDNR